MYKRKFKKDILIKENKSIKKKKQFKIKDLYGDKEFNLTKIFYYKFLFLLFLFFLIIDTEKGQKFICFFIKDIKNLKGDIIFENSYDDFENTKHIFIKDPFLKYHLGNITILIHAYNKNYKKLKNNKINVHICVGLNDQYIFPLLVSMQSVLLNCDKDKTFLIYHILCAPDVTEKTLTILKSLMNKYSLNLEMIFYGMGNNFMYLHDKNALSQVTYYRLLLPIFVNLKKILYLDGDTLVYKDLGEMYQLDFKNNSVMGSLDYYSYGVDYLGIKSDKCICAGVILINLEKIRNDKKYYDLINITKIWLNNDDQTAINFILYPDIGILPNKYNIFNFYDTRDIQVYGNWLRQKINVTEIEEVIKEPTIVHHALCTPKIWNKKTRFFDHVTACNQRNDCSCLKYHNIWLSFANKTDYYQEILKYIDGL